MESLSKCKRLLRGGIAGWKHVPTSESHRKVTAELLLLSLLLSEHIREDQAAPLVDFFIFFLPNINLLACQVRVTVGDSGLCCCVCVTAFDC